MATMQRKCSGGIIFVIITKIITKLIVPRNYFVILSARMVIRESQLFRFAFLCQWYGCETSRSRPEGGFDRTAGTLP